MLKSRRSRCESLHNPMNAPITMSIVAAESKTLPTFTLSGPPSIQLGTYAVITKGVINGTDVPAVPLSEVDHVVISSTSNL